MYTPFPCAPCCLHIHIQPISILILPLLLHFSGLAPKKKKSRREPLRRPCDFSGQENWSMENNGGWKEQEEPFIGREKFRIPQPASSRRRHRNQQLPTADEVGWGCPQCTFINPPRVPGCRQCSHERPEDYEIPKMGSYVMDKDEARIEASFETNEQAFAMVSPSHIRCPNSPLPLPLPSLFPTEHLNNKA